MPVTRPAPPPQPRTCSPTGCGCSDPTTRTPWPPAATSRTGGAQPVKPRTRCKRSVRPRENDRRFRLLLTGVIVDDAVVVVGEGGGLGLSPAHLHGRPNLHRPGASSWDVTALNQNSGGG